MNKREMQRECSRLRIEVARLESTLGERNQRIGRLRERVQVAERGYTGAIEEQGRLLGRLEAAEMRIDDAEQAITSLIAERDEALATIRRLEQELERERQVVEGMEQVINQHPTQLAAAFVDGKANRHHPTPIHEVPGVVVEPEAIRYALGESGADLPGASEA